MKLKKQSKLAIIGCGAVTANFYVPALKSIKAHPKFFIDKDLGSAKKVADKFKNSIATDNIDNIINEFDEAIITLPNNLHYPFSLKLIQNGKHLLVEKPITITSKESQELINLSKENDVKIICGNMRRQLRSALFIKELIRSKTLGNIIKFKCREGGVFNWPIQSANFWDKENSGGGVLMDTGSHTLEQIIYHFGMPENIEYMDNKIDNIESDCFLKMQYQNYSGTLQLSRTIGLDCKIFIKFEKGNVVFDVIGNKIELDCDDSLIPDTGIENFSHAGQSYDNLIAKQIIEWYNYIDGKKANIVSINEAHNVMKIIDYCYSNSKRLDF